MRILEYGHIKPHIKVCTSCKCKFEWVEYDVKELRHIRYVRCPACGAVNVLYEEDMED